MSNNYGPKIVTDGLVLCLDAADRNSYPGSGNTWYDLSGNGNNGTLTNGPTFSNGNGGSIAFDGSNDSVVNTYTSNFHMDTNSTIEVIFKCNSSLTNSTDSRQSLFSNSTSISFGLEIGIFSGCNIDSTTGFRFLMHRQGSCFSAVSAANAWVQSEICFFTYTRDASRGEKMFVNGQEITPQQANGYPYSAGSSSSFFGIRQGTGGGQRLNGNIYKTSIYSKALTPQEIQQNYNATKGRFGL